MIGTATGIDDNSGERVVLDFALNANYPNPFNPSTVISYQLPKTSHVELSIYNRLGTKVSTIVQQSQPAGAHKIEWNGRDSNGRQLVSGVYFYRLTAGTFTQVRKMLLMK